MGIEKKKQYKRLPPKGWVYGELGCTHLVREVSIEGKLRRIREEARREMERWEEEKAKGFKFPLPKNWLTKKQKEGLVTRYDVSRSDAVAIDK